MSVINTFADLQQIKLHLAISPNDSRITVADACDDLKSISRLKLSLDLNTIGGEMIAEVEAESVDMPTFMDNGELTFEIAKSKYSIVEGFLILRKSTKDLIEEQLGERIITI